ncbi:MAG: Ig-like domain-containing protein [Bacteroidales bacterium]|nr:Ig-like domain-containing protein [Bacteroidales bacterium]
MAKSSSQQRQRQRVWIAGTLQWTAMAVVLLSASACAKQGYPSGGPKDTTPPVVVEAKPKVGTRHFDQPMFTLHFDEYAVMKDADRNVIVSPPLKHKPEYVVKGKRLQVRLTDTLLPEATYLFQFKEAIADFNEGNVLPSYEYVFATGEDMDTMMLCGRVVSAHNGKPWKEQVAVLAYRDSLGMADTVAAQRAPDYQTRCAADGSFAFHYIRQGDYRLVAVEDKNRNLRVERGEAAAWTASAATATDSLDSTRLVQMHISAPDVRRQRLLKSEFTTRGRAMIVSYLPMQSPTLTGDSLEWRLNAGRDTLRVWFRNEQCTEATLVLTDTALADTLRLRFQPPRRKRRVKGTEAEEKPEGLVKAICEGSKAFYDDLRLAFTTPILAPADSLTAEVMHVADSHLTRCTFEVDSLGLGARLHLTLQAGEKYRIRLRQGLFTDLLGHPSDSLEFTLTPCDYGSIKLHISNLTGQQLAVELLDDKDSVRQVQPMSGSSEVLFSHLKAGEYRLRAVVDTDANGVWTTGDYFTARQPETTVDFEKSLQVRERWEIEERWMVALPLSPTLPPTSTP